jgi:hypothetical protein
VHYVVTEHGAVDLSVLSDSERPGALVELAHPDFRDSLRASGLGGSGGDFASTDFSSNVGDLLAAASSCAPTGGRRSC